ncbi:MAG: DegT/DnrJ/EryC1/StrS family aminotransferase [Clostridia bacterium]|nr:DegT/DnrJ/EryC1/StrS family aminotransferase [Clostridia bacterium]
MNNKPISLSPPDITNEEINAVVDVLKSGWITTGPVTKRFETEISAFCGTDKSVCLNSATAGLELSLRVLGIGPGDEVITTAYTYTASASVIEHVGAKIIMVDTGVDSYEIDYDAVERAITPNTKAVIPVDIAGVMCDYIRLKNILDSKKSLFSPANDLQKSIGRVAIVADAAHSIGAVRDGMKSGQAADFTSFSFHAIKNVTTAEGGAVTWMTKPGISDHELYKEFMLLSLHGQNKDALAKAKLGGWEFDIKCTGYKCNMTDIAAAIGSVQLKRYPVLLKRRREIVEIYNDGLKGLPCVPITHICDTFESSMHLYLVRMNGKNAIERDAVFMKMAENQIATLVHYKPLPMMTAYKQLGFDIKNYPNAYKQFENEISLPIHTLLTNEDVYRVIDTFNKLI